MLWLNFIHLYQPANMERDKLIEATEKSYERLLRALEENAQLKLTANIAGALLERWATDLERADLLERFRKLIRRGQLEIVGSAAYHALLPLVTAAEARSQIAEQERLLQKYLGCRRPKGFFLPEMAYSPAIAKQVKKAGYQWLIVDEITIHGHEGEMPGQVFIDAQSGLKVIARNRQASESYVPDTIKELLDAGGVGLLVTATDAELYGLRHVDHAAVFEKIIRLPAVRTDCISRHIGRAKKLKKAMLRPSNWQSTETELLQGRPYSLWQNERNAVHRDLWKLADMAQELFYRHSADGNAWWSRWHLWRGLASCSWWWASKNDFRQVFGPLAWSPDEVEKGVSELIRSIRSLEASTDQATKVRAEKLAQKIRADIWVRHWQQKKI